MELKTVLKELSLESYQEGFAQDWNESETLFNTTEILSEKFIIECAKLSCIDNDTIDCIIKAAQRINDFSSLKRVFVHTHYLLFLCNEPIVNLPEMEKELGDAGYEYNLLLALSGVMQSKKYFKDLNMPKDVAEGAFKDISLWVKHYKNNLGIAGLTTRTLRWECSLLKGKLFRIGRLQFNIMPFEGNIVVYRNKLTNQVQALAADGIELNLSGQFFGVDGELDKTGVWTSRLLRNEQQVSGNPVSPLGNIEHKIISLNLSEWDEVLAHGDSVLDTHIPAGESFTPQACADSLNCAIEFFAKYFPEKHFKGWACHSWFLDNQYETILSENSNIVKFQRELYLYPISESGEDSYWRIFGENGMKNGIKNAPRNTSMQKAVAEFIEKGGKLRAGGGFFLKDDTPWGRQFYRKMGL